MQARFIITKHKQKNQTHQMKLCKTRPFATLYVLCQHQTKEYEKNPCTTIHSKL